MHTDDQLILLIGLLGLLSILAGQFFARLKAPLLLVFLVLGLLAGEDGPGGLVYNDFHGAYVIGSIALAVILFYGGLETSPSMLRLAGWPALMLATVGTALTAAVVGFVAWAAFDIRLEPAFLVGAVTAPTDAAAIGLLLRGSGIRLAPRLFAVLEIESGLNDPMAVFLTLLLTSLMLAGNPVTAADAGLMFLREMLGGTMLGLAGGGAMRLLLRILRLDKTLVPAFAVLAALTLFGVAQVMGASGFLALYLAGIVLGSSRQSSSRTGLGMGLERTGAIIRFLEPLNWLAQIGLFLMLGLLATPHLLGSWAVLGPSLLLGITLLLLARPIGVFICLAPFGFRRREMVFVSWVGLRGGVPIFLTIIPVLAGVESGTTLFGVVIVIVLASLVLQGWSIAPMARLLGMVPQDGDEPGQQFSLHPK